LTVHQSRVSLRDTLVLDVALLNDGRRPVWVYAAVGWGSGAGLVMRIRNDEGREVRPQFGDDGMLPPPPSNDDPTMFARLDQGNFFGTRRRLRLKDFFAAPGRYTLQVEYQSLLACDILDPRLQGLHALWREDGSLLSNEVAIDILP